MNPEGPLETQSGSCTVRRLKLARTMCSMLSNVDLDSKKLTKASVVKSSDNVCYGQDHLVLLSETKIYRHLISSLSQIKWR
jgi:microcompartment protein CcmK/EutM